MTPDNVTSIGTDLDLLTDAIHEQHALVLNSGVLHLQSCHRLGVLLVEARGYFPHHGGGWRAYLDEIGMQESRAQRFITLAKLDSSDLTTLAEKDLTVTAALEYVRGQSQVARDERQRRQRAEALAEMVSDGYLLPDMVEIWEADALDTGLADLAVEGLIVFSPPYSVGLEYESVEDSNWQLYCERVGGWCAELWRISAPSTRVVVNVATDTWDSQEDMPRDLTFLWKACLYAQGFSYRTTIDWRDNEQHNGRGRVAFGSIDSANAPNVINPTERLIVVHKGQWNLGRQDPHDLPRSERLEWLTGVWNILGEHRKRGHPAPFPEELVRRLILLYTFPGDTVYDPFVGSGTTPKVAHDLGRQAWGSDVWPAAVALAQQRLSDAGKVAIYA